LGRQWACQCRPCHASIRKAMRRAGEAPLAGTLNRPPSPPNR
jgi:hypothetical protein